MYTTRTWYTTVLWLFFVLSPIVPDARCTLNSMSAWQAGTPGQDALTSLAPDHKQPV